MVPKAGEYVFHTPQGGWRITGTRVSLDSIVRAYWDGRSSEAIVEDFPALSLEQVHGAIAFYLHNQGEMDRYLRAQDALWDQIRQESETRHGPLLARIRASQRAPSPKGEPV